MLIQMPESWVQNWTLILLPSLLQGMEMFPAACIDPFTFLPVPPTPAPFLVLVAMPQGMAFSQKIQWPWPALGSLLMC